VRVLDLVDEHVLVDLLEAGLGATARGPGDLRGRAPAGAERRLAQAYTAALDRGIPSEIIQTFLVSRQAEGTP
jgi:hypothetical protein